MSNNACSVGKNASDNLPEDLLFCFPFLRKLLCWVHSRKRMGIYTTESGLHVHRRCCLEGHVLLCYEGKVSPISLLSAVNTFPSWISPLHTTIGLVHDQISQFTHTLGNVAQHPLSSPNSAVLCAANSSTLHDGAATVHRRSSCLMHPLSV